MTRRTRWRRAGSLAALVVGGLAVAGCQSVDAPSPSASPSVTESSDQPTPSPTASPSDPGIPTAAREHSEEGAKAFASFYLEQTGRSWMVPNPSLLDGHATANCQTCANLQSIADRLLREEQRYLVAPIEVLGLTRFSGTTDKWVFDVKLRQVEVKVVDKVGKTVKTQHGRRLDRAVAVVWQGERWLVDGISE